MPTAHSGAQTVRHYNLFRSAEINGQPAPGVSSGEALSVMEQLAAARVPAGKVYTAKDIAEDPHYRARDMILQQRTRDGDTLEVPGIVPKLSATPGTVRSNAPHVGDDTDAVLREMGLSAEQIATLRGRGIVQ